MADDLERLVRSIDGEGPSPDFVTALRERIEAETSTPTISDGHPVPEIDLRQSSRETAMATRWKLISLAAAVLLALLVFVAVRDSDRLDTVGDEGETPTTTTVTPTSESPSGDSAPFVSDATPLDTEGSELEPGEYRVDTVGTPFSFTLDQPMTAQFNREGFLQLSLAPPGQWRGPDDEDINVLRPTTLVDPARPTDIPQSPDDGWPADDFTGWLENLDGGIVVSDVEETTLGGLDAVRVDLELGDVECPPGGQCVILATNFVNGMALNPGSTYRMWMVDQGAEAPMAFVVGVDTKDDIAWLDTAEGMLATLAFGDVAPSPIQRPPSGSIELPLLEGIRLDLPENSTVVPGPVPELGSIRFDGSPGWMQFFVNPSDLSGSPLESAELEARLLAAGGEVAEVDSRSVGGIEAGVVDFTGASQSVAVTWGPDSSIEPGFDGFLGTRNRIWLIDHPERGLLVATAEDFEDDDETFSVMVANAEAVLDSLEFIDLE